jgi:hypothetical protein
MPRAKNRRLYAKFGDGRHKVWAEAIAAGEDIVIFIGGGERPHVGSLSLADAGHAPFSASIPGHKDYLVSSKVATRVSKELGKTCAVVAGIHVDNATKPDIGLLLKNSDKCLDLLIGQLKGR